MLHVHVSDLFLPSRYSLQSFIQSFFLSYDSQVPGLSHIDACIHTCMLTMATGEHLHMT